MQVKPAWTGPRRIAIDESQVVHDGFEITLTSDDDARTHQAEQLFGKL
jgi:hypothetical protein